MAGLYVLRMRFVYRAGHVTGLACGFDASSIAVHEWSSMLSFRMAIVFNLYSIWMQSSATYTGLNFLVTILIIIIIAVIIILAHALTDTGETLKLFPEESVYTCSGEVLSFTCFTRNATDVQWNIQFTQSFTTDVRVTLIEDDPIAQLYNVTKEGHVFSFNILSQNPMISELITTAATVIDGAVVQCHDVSSHNKNPIFDSSDIFIIDQGEHLI